MAKFFREKGIWYDFFHFGLPAVDYERLKNVLNYSQKYRSENGLPSSYIKITLYNPLNTAQNMIMEIKYWIDDEIGKLRPEKYYKQAEYDFALEEILYQSGEQLTIMVLRDATTYVQRKRVITYPYDVIFKSFEDKFEVCLDLIQEWIPNYLKEETVTINQYIALNLDRELCRVCCDGTPFWTFIKEDVRRVKPSKITLPYEQWFTESYLPQAWEMYHPEALKFSTCIKLFEQWNDSSLRNIDFTWHFYSHLMSRLHKAGHPNAIQICRDEFKQHKEQKIRFRDEINQKKLVEEGKWNDWFTIEIPEEKITQLIHSTETWKIFPPDPQSKIPRSIIEMKFYPVEESQDKWLKLKWYLERTNEIREIEYEQVAYFKYWEFLAKKRIILESLGEKFKLISHLNDSTIITFMNPETIRKEILFPSFKEKVGQIIQEFSR